MGSERKVSADGAAGSYHTSGTGDMLNDLVSRVNIYPDEVLEVKLNFADALEELPEQLTEVI